jgi:predicted Zn-dependent protease
MFEAIFGAEGEVDAKILAGIEVSPREERQIGKQAVEAYLSQLKAHGLRVVRAGKDVEYLRSLVEKIHPLMSQRERYPQVEIVLVLSDRCDARCFPGGYLVFFRGLLEWPENEAALIGMVGHELAHLGRGHQTRRIQQMKLAERTFSGRSDGMTPEKFFAVGGVMMRGMLRPFRPDYEREADLDGARWSYQAGYDCREMARLFLQHEQRNPAGGLPIPEFFRSHPTGADRHQAIMDEYERLQREKPREDLVKGEENLRARVAVPGEP